MHPSTEHAALYGGILGIAYNAATTATVCINGIITTGREIAGHQHVGDMTVVIDISYYRAYIVFTSYLGIQQMHIVDGSVSGIAKQSLIIS